MAPSLGSCHGIYYNFPGICVKRKKEIGYIWREIVAWARFGFACMCMFLNCRAGFLGKETCNPVDDGQEIIMVNCSVNDGTIISELMTCFTQTEIDNNKFPCMKSRMHYIKNQDGGQEEMCELMDQYAEKYAKEAVNKTWEEGLKNTIIIVKSLGKSLDETFDLIKHRDDYKSVTREQIAKYYD